MVNENQIPKTETVYELKDKYEIPSFEEFMQSYKFDESLNYDDLNGGDISEVKGYGPCYDSRCRGSNACLPGERFFDLKTKCPAKECTNTETTYWYHANCGSSSRDKISDECRIRCPNCFDTDHMKYSSFKCRLHSTEFRKTSSASFTAAIMMALNSGLPEDVYLKIISGIKREHDRSGW